MPNLFRYLAPRTDLMWIKYIHKCIEKYEILIIILFHMTHFPCELVKKLSILTLTIKFSYSYISQFLTINLFIDIQVFSIYQE